ncbi:cytochrome c oxidase assembly protein [Xanthobacteraceae bacterium A53D]
MDARETPETGTPDPASAAPIPAAPLPAAPTPAYGRKGSRRSERTIVLGCVAFVGAMIGVTYASVPLYQMFCAITGFGGTTRQADAAPGAILDRKIAVRFDANTAPGLSWEFRPEQRQMDVKVGETSMAYYFAGNRSAADSYANATYNVTPPTAGAYFVKLECFCFTEQKLAGNEKVDMPVVFYIDPAIADDPEMAGLTSITLSYTFFPAQPGTRPQAQATPQKPQPKPM